MKKILCIAAALAVSVLALNAQKKVRPFIELGAGVSYETCNGYGEPVSGLSTSLSAGLDIMLNENWSIMPTIGQYDYTGNPKEVFQGYEGVDYDIISMFSCAVLGNYHFDVNGKKFIVGLGPALYFIENTDKYYIDWDPNDPRAGLAKNKSKDWGLRASFARDLRKHWTIGINGNIGLGNVLIQYPDLGITGNNHLFSLNGFVAFKF